MKDTVSSASPSYFRYERTFMQRATLVSTILIATIFWSTNESAQADPLSSWNDTAAKKGIVEFVERTTKEGSPDVGKSEERIATIFPPTNAKEQ